MSKNRLTAVTIIGLLLFMPTWTLAGNLLSAASTLAVVMGSGLYLLLAVFLFGLIPITLAAWIEE